MVDIHTHILYDVDDGSDTLEESIAILKKAAQSGVTDIIFTPHYIDKTEYDKDKVEEAFNTLKEKTAELEIPLNVYLGNEIAVYGNIDEILSDDRVNTLAGSKYILIEFPMSIDVNYVLDTIYEIRIKGYVPVIAHPERCECFVKNYNLIVEAAEAGALLQCNTGSFLGTYGEKAKKIVQKLLKKHLITFLATDVHREKSERYNELELVKKKVQKLSDNIEAFKIFELNAKKILSNEDIY